MKDGVGLADIGEKLVSEAFSLAGALDESGDVHNVHCRRHYALGFTHVRKYFKPLVRHVCGSKVRLNRAERKIGALGLSGADAVEQS